MQDFRFTPESGHRRRGRICRLRAKSGLMTSVPARQSRRHIDAVFRIIGQDFERGAVPRLEHLGRVRKPVCQVQRAAGNLAVETVFGAPGGVLVVQPYKRLSKAVR